MHIVELLSFICKRSRSQGISPRTSLLGVVGECTRIIYISSPSLLYSKVTIFLKQKNFHHLSCRPSDQTTLKGLISGIKTHSKRPNFVALLIISVLND